MIEPYTLSESTYFTLQLCGVGVLAVVGVLVVWMMVERR